MRMEQEPHTSSMQLDSQATGATRSPSAVTGVSRMAIREDTTLCPAR